MKVEIPSVTTGSSTTITLPSSSSGDALLVGVECDPSETPAVSGWSSHVVSASTTKLTVFYLVRGAGAPATSLTGTTDHRLTVCARFAAGTFDPTTPFTFDDVTQESGISLDVDCPASEKGDVQLVFLATGEDISTTQPRLFGGRLPDDVDGANGLIRLSANGVTTGNGGRLALFGHCETRAQPVRAATLQLGVDVPAVAVSVRVKCAADTSTVLARYAIKTTKPLQTTTSTVDVTTFTVPAGHARKVDIDVRARLRQYAAPVDTVETTSAAFTGAGTTGTFTIASTGRGLDSWLYVLTYHGITGIVGMSLVDQRTDYLGNVASLYRVKRAAADSRTYTVNRTSGVAGRVMWFYLFDGAHDPDDVQVIFEDLTTSASATIVYDLDDPVDGEARTLICGGWCTSGAFNGSLTASSSCYRPSQDAYSTTVATSIYTSGSNNGFMTAAGAPLVNPFDLAFTSASQTNAHTGTKFRVVLKRSTDPLFYDEPGAEQAWTRGSLTLRTTVPADSTLSATMTDERVAQNIWHSAAVQGTYASGSKRTATVQITTPTFTAAPIEVEGTVVVRGTPAVATYTPAIGEVAVSASLAYVGLTFAFTPTVGAGAITIREVGTDTAVLTISNASTDGRVTTVGNQVRVDTTAVTWSTTPKGYYVDVSDAVVAGYEGTYKVNGADGRSNWYFTPRSVRQHVTNNLLVLS